jgi:hypothetical protein
VEAGENRSVTVWQRALIDPWLQKSEHYTKKAGHTADGVALLFQCGIVRFI